MTSTVDFAAYLNVKNAVMPMFSADGSRLFYLSDLTGTLQVWTVPLSGGWADQLTFFEERVTGLFAAPTGDQFLFTRDRGGDEQNQLYLLRGSREQGVNIRTLKEDFKIKHMWGAWKPAGTAIAFSSNERDPAYFDVYTQPLMEGAGPTMVARFDGYADTSDWSSSGRYLLITLNHSNIHHDLFLLDLPTGTLRSLTAHLGQGMFLYTQFSSDEQAIYVSTDVGRDFRALCRLDLATLQLDALAAPPWDVELFKISPDGERVAYVVNEGGRFSVYLHEM